MLIANRMTLNPITATPDMNIREAAKIMAQEKVHRLPVLDRNKNLVGVISEKDILKAEPSSASTLSTFEMNFLIEQLTVKKIMSRNPVTVPKTTTIEEAARLMADQDLSCLPVTEDGKLIGIVSKSDLFKILLETFGARYFGVRVDFLVEDKPGVLAKVCQALSEKDIQIISSGTFNGNDPTTKIISMKVQGIDEKGLLKIIKPLVLKVEDIREI